VQKVAEALANAEEVVVNKVAVAGEEHDPCT
jgi:hypothetical protein